MNDYIFFSKSNWAEAPRLRHQLAALLRGFGGRVKFFQKPSFVWRHDVSEEVAVIGDGFVLARTRQLIHHQLRVLPILSWFNALVEKRSIRARLGKHLSTDIVIINFNYDYYFLRDVFPKNIIITIINDDFVSQSRFFSGRHAKESLRQTCINSDAVLTVSYPLMRQLSAWCRPELFFPWADVVYKAPLNSGVRNSVLLWAHIDGRVDFDLLRTAIAKRPEVFFYLVGPLGTDVKGQVSLFDSSPNVVIMPSAELDDLSLENFFAAIIPYKQNVGAIEAVTMSNKSLQLMSRGLPLITHGMPEFYEHPAIVKAVDVAGFLLGLDHFRENFFTLQNHISNFVSQNQPRDRFEFLKKVISKFETGA